MKRNPSIRDLFASTGTIESLAAMRAEMLRALGAGEIQPSEKTLREWQEAMWLRVFELMANEPRSAPYIYNVTLRWEKPAKLAAALDRWMQDVTAPVMSDGAILRMRGILQG